MHQRGLCLCPDCVVRDAGHAETCRSDVRAIRAAELDAPLSNIRRVTTKVADGVVKRGRELVFHKGQSVGPSCRVLGDILGRLSA